MSRIQRTSAYLRTSYLRAALIVVILVVAGLRQGMATAGSAWPNTGDVLVVSGTQIVAVDPATRAKTLIIDVSAYTDPEIQLFSPTSVVMSRDGFLWLAYRNSAAVYSNGSGPCTGCGGVVLRVNPDGSHSIVGLGFGLFPTGIAASPDGSVAVVTGSSNLARMLRIHAADAVSTSVDSFFVPQTTFFPGCATPVIQGYAGYVIATGATKDELSRPYIFRDANKNIIAAAAAAGLADSLSGGQLQPVRTDDTGYIVNPPGYIVGGNICDGDAVAFRQAHGVTVDQTTGNIFVGDVEAGIYTNTSESVPFCEQFGDCGGLYKLTLNDPLTVSQKLLIADFDNPNGFGPLGEDAGMAVAQYGSQFLVSDSSWWPTHDQQNSPTDPCGKAGSPAECNTYGAVFTVASNGHRTLLTAYGDTTQGQTGVSSLASLPMTVTLDGSILLASCDGNNGPYFGTNSLGQVRIKNPDSICQVDPATGIRTLWSDFGETFNGAPLKGAQAISVVLPALVLTPTATTIAQSSNGTTYGDPVTFTAFVTGNGGTPTGRVTFYDGGTAIGAGTLDPSGTASYSTTALGAGSHTITAAYGGDLTFAASVSIAIAHPVGQATTTTSLITSLNPAAVGQAVTFVATITSQFGQVPTGTVTFLDGGTVLASQPVDATGKASLTTSTLSAGAHPVSALYSGDPNFLASASSSINEAVGDAADLSVVILSSPAAPAIGSNVTLTIDIRNNGPNNVSSAFVQLGLSATMRFVSASSGAFNGATQVWAVGALASGATSEVQVIATIASFAGSATATITSASLPDPVLGNNSATAQIQPSGVINVNALCPLRAAIVAANTDAAFGGCPAGTPGLDIIVLPPNSFHLYGDVYETIDAANGGDALPAVTSPIQIEGQSAVVGRTVNPVAPPPDMRVFYVKKGGSLTLHNVTVRDAHVVGPGAGVLLEGKGASVVIDSSNIVNNTSTNAYGAGIASSSIGVLDDGDITIRNSSLVAGNTALYAGYTYAGLGGGVFASANLTVDNSTIGSGTVGGTAYPGNIAAAYGGGVFIYSGQASITNSTVYTNSTPGYGGGVYIYSGQATIANTVLQENSAALEGGGMFVESGPAVVHISSGNFFKNTAGAKGGGLSNDANLTVDNSIISANTVTGAQGLGGAVVTGRFGTTQITGTYIQSNQATIGAGIWNSRQTTLIDTFVEYNSAFSGGGIVNAGIFAMLRGSVDNNATLANAAYDNNGGGILNLPVNDVGPSAQLVLNGTAVYWNGSAGSGGGIATYGPATLTNVIVGGTADQYGNRAVKSGGGIFVANGGLPGAAPAAVPSLTINGGSITHNTAFGAWGDDQGGGGLANGSPTTAGGVVALTDVTLDSNKALNGLGGGVVNRGTVTITRGSISFNQAAAAGALSNGTYSVSGGAVSLVGTQVVSNVASGVQAGGILNTHGGTLDTRDAIIDGNSSAMFGGNIYNGFASAGVTIRGGSIRNGTSQQGGGIYSESGPLTLQDGAIVESNTATDPTGGGGLYVATSAPVRISDTTIRGNQTSGVASGVGGGLLAFGSTDISIDRTSFVGNSAFDCAAINAVSNGAVGSRVVVTNTTISGNVAPDQYAAFCVAGGSGMTLANSTISGNHSFENIYNAGTTTVDSSTIVDNDGHIASTAAGGSFSISNSIVAANHGLLGTDCFVSPVSPATTVVSGGYNLFGEADGCPTVATDKTIDPATLFTAVLAPLGDNGGPTQTHALVTGSPAIDSGAPTCPTTDQRGQPRPVDGNGDDVVGCDIGAFELQAAQPGVATHFMVAAPGGANPGTPFSVRITALDAANNVASGYSGTVQFTSSDGAATLPGNSALINGGGLFSATLRTGGAQTITTTDISTGITGTSDPILVTAILPPVIAKAFAPMAIQAGQISTLTITISNPNAGATLNGAAFDDPFPVDLFVADTPNVTNTCGGTVTAVAGTASVALSGGTVVAGASCQVTVAVTAIAGGPHTNRTSAVTSLNGGTGNIAAAELDVNGAPSSTTLTVTPVPAVSGHLVTLTAVVTPSGGATATGQMAFLADGVQIGRQAVTANQATFTSDSLGLGTHAFIATYLGDATVASSTSAPVSDTVNDAVTSPSHSVYPNPKMDYYGGPVVSNVDVRVVFWGVGVDPTVQSRIGDFYAAIVASPFMDLLGEYSTVGLVATAGVNIGQPGSNQRIGHGTYGGAVTIAPTVCQAPPCLVYDSQIRDEINLQIHNGALPAPSYDVAGHPNTAYMVYFPPGVTINFGSPGAPGGNSCATFLGYHETGTTTDGRDLLYAVQPDLGSCPGGPFGEPTPFEDTTVTSTHELAELVTDPSGGKVLSSPLSAPIGWYSEQQSTAKYYGESNDYGEIGDVCGFVAGALTGFTVQLVWSNQQDFCALAGTPASTVGVTVGTTPGGATFTVDGVTYSAPQTFTWSVGSTHTLDTSSPQATGAGTRLVWTAWSDGQPISHSVTASAGTTTYTATFSTEYQLTTTASPAAGGAVSPSTGQFYAAGSNVNMTATANPGYVFANWTGVVADPNAASTTVTMSAPQTVMANFSVAPPVLQSIAVTPANPSIAAGFKQGFTATGSYSDASTKDLTATVTWTSATPGVATITAAGVATGISVGTSAVSATLGGITGSTVLTVTPAVLQSIAVTPANPSAAIGSKQSFTATGSYSDGSTKDVTASVAWTSATPGVATISNAGLASGTAVGTSVISATISGVTGSTVLTVTKAATTTAVTSSANPSLVGQTVTVTATVNGYVPAGSVTFNVDGGAVVIGPLTLISGSASTSLSGLAAGTHSIVANYSGDTNNQPSASAALSQVVNTGVGKVPTTVTVTTSGSPSVFGTPVTFTATVTGASPTGTVTFADQNSTLGTVPLINGVATLTTSSLSKGAHQVTATYNGDNANLPRTSAKVKQQVQ